MEKHLEKADPKINSITNSKDNSAIVNEMVREMDGEEVKSPIKDMRSVVVDSSPDR